MAKRKPAGAAGTAVSPLKPIGSIYKRNLALLTDLYQLTMGYGYWKSGRAETGTVFNLYFRKNRKRRSAPIAPSFSL